MKSKQEDGSNEEGINKDEEDDCASSKDEDSQSDATSSGDEDFISAWDKVMMADRFDLK